MGRKNSPSDCGGLKRPSRFCAWERLKAIVSFRSFRRLLFQIFPPAQEPSTWPALTTTETASRISLPSALNVTFCGFSLSSTVADSWHPAQVCFIGCRACPILLHEPYLNSIGITTASTIYWSPSTPAMWCRSPSYSRRLR